MLSLHAFRLSGPASVALVPFISTPSESAALRLQPPPVVLNRKPDPGSLGSRSLLPLTKVKPLGMTTDCIRDRPIKKVPCEEREECGGGGGGRGGRGGGREGGREGASERAGEKD